jgi:hypothetical protein
VSVGHGGGESKHSGEEKLFILEYLEARLNDIVDDYNLNVVGEDVSVEVYDPYNTEMDFFVIVKAKRDTFSKTLGVYEAIHKDYHTKTMKPGGKEEKFEKAWGKKWGWDFDDPGKGAQNKQKFNDKKKDIFDYDKFHASTSKTMMLYSIDQMANLYGETRPPP